MFGKSGKKKAAKDDAPEEGEPDGAETPPPRPAAPVSAPAKASCLTFVVLVLAVIVTICVAYFVKPGLITEKGPIWWISIVVLPFVIPIVVYRAVTLWMFDESARYPDLSYAWSAGLAELASHGMSLSSAPLFLIVGTGNDRLRRNFMNAAGGEFFIDGVCDAPAPFYWYANSDGIFLYLNDVSWMNAAIALYEAHADARRSGFQLPGDRPRGGAGARPIVRALGTLVPGLRMPAPPQRPSRPGNVPSDNQATIDLSQPVEVSHPVTANAPEKASPPPKSSGANYMGTITPDQLIAPASAGAAQRVSAPATGRSASAAGQKATNRLTSQQSSLQLQRLEHLCGVLRRHRHPVCPVNGVLTLLPFEMLKAGDQDVAELERAIAADLTTIYGELQLRCPVTAVVVGMDQERGFRELIRRIGREDVAKQRFGQRFDLRTPATVDELQKFTSHVCGTFEDWVYTLFREEQALSHPGNTALYALLCKVRRTLKQRLGDVLGKGFGYDRQSNKMPVLFSGCYFAATGPKSDRQAFVSGLLNKLYDEQEDIEWTAEALREDQRRGWLIRMGWAVFAATVLLTVVWQAWKYYHNDKPNSHSQAEQATDSRIS